MGNPSDEGSVPFKVRETGVLTKINGVQSLGRYFAPRGGGALFLHSSVGGHYSVAIAYDRTDIKTSSGAGKEMLAAVMDVRNPLRQEVKNN